jgi:hypothetical protein
MNLRKLLLALTAVAMLASVFAASASAAETEAVTPTESHWTVEGKKLAAGAAEKVKCFVGEHNSEKMLHMTGTIGEGAGVEAEITATGIDCINHEGTDEGNGSARIEQVGTSAQDFGRLKFTGVKVVKPAHCTVAETITTNPLKSEIYMHKLKNVAVDKVFDRFEPTGTNFVTLVIGSEAGFTCAIAGNRIVKGFVYGQSVAGDTATLIEKPTSTGAAGANPDAVVQSLTFSKAIDETAGSALTFGGNPAHLTGRVDNELVSGKKWGASQ